MNTMIRTGAASATDVAVPPLSVNEQELTFLVNNPEVGNYASFLRGTYATCQPDKLNGGAVNLQDAFVHVFGDPSTPACAWCVREFAKLREDADRLKTKQ